MEAERAVPRIEVIAFDADDTLWHTERLYAEAQDSFKQLMAQYHPPEWIERRLYETEMRNLQHFGYGIKAFALSMIETAVELTEGRVTGRDIRAVLDRVKMMLAADVQLLPHAVMTVQALAATHRLMLITKGDLFEQEGKISRSGLAPYFERVEVVSDKTRATYQGLLAKYSLRPAQFMMVGNSLRSDVWPVLELGASAVYVPYPVTWAHETAAAPPAGHAGFYQIEHLGELAELLKMIDERRMTNDERRHCSTGPS
jgi:putative hydrolase of the HAD superfamily